MTKHLGLSPNMIDGYDIKVYAFAFNREVCNHEAQCIYKLSIGSVCNDCNDPILR